MTQRWTQHSCPQKALRSIYREESRQLYYGEKKPAGIVRSCGTWAHQQTISLCHSYSHWRVIHWLSWNQSSYFNNATSFLMFSFWLSSQISARLQSYWKCLPKQFPLKAKYFIDACHDCLLKRRSGNIFQKHFFKVGRSL